MAEDKATRRLAAIFAADMVGYSRLIEADEEGTIARQKVHRRELIDPKIAEHEGRIVKLMGDGMLVEFASVVDAVRCAVEVQKAMAEREADVPEERRIIYRVGINLGDIVIEGDDVLGDGVNIAARLEALAKPGEVLISGTAFDHLKKKLEYGYHFRGKRKVKNIAEPVRMYGVLPDSGSGTVSGRQRLSPTTWRWVAGAAVVLLLMVAGMAWWQPWTSPIERASANSMKFRLPSKPSIAVLPFANLSQNKDQQSFADGITEDIITDLSKISGLFVVAHHSTHGYKGKAIPVPRIAEELGVRYVLNGSVRRASNKLRITARLIDAIKGEHLWAGRYDREVKDVFAVQSDVTRRVVNAMAVTLKARERDRVFQKYVTNIEAYDAWQRARATVEVPSRANVLKGEALFKKTIELDPKFAGGYAGLSFNHSVKARFRYSESPKREIERALSLARKAIEVDPDFAWSHIAMAGAHLANGNHDAAVDAVEKALAIQPGGYETNLFMGFYLNWAMESARAVKHLEIANNLNRVPAYRDLTFLGVAYIVDGQYVKAEATLLRAQKLLGTDRHPPFYIYLAAAQVAQNKMAEARETASRLLRVSPGIRLSKVGNLRTFKSEAFRRQIIAFAVKAGIPK